MKKISCNFIVRSTKKRIIISPIIVLFYSDVGRALKVLALGLLLSLGLAANAQSFNVDLDTFFGGPETGNGAPSPAFGAAANDPGYWNRYDANGYTSPKNLYGLDGFLSPVQLLSTGGQGSSGGFNNPSNTGDFALLLNDYAQIGNEIDYHFTGFLPGRYDIYTYAVNPTGMTVDVQVTVDGADDPVQHVTGPMPGNRFVQGITHSVHHLNLTGDAFTIQVSGPWPDSVVNGFQIVAVPEPASLLILAAGLPVLVKRWRGN